MFVRLKQILQHERLAIRVTGTLTTGYALLYLAWVVGYYLLPDRALHGWLSAGVSMTPTNLPALALQILGYNLALPGLLLVALSRMRAGGYSLGYNVPFINAVLYGLWLGTNSFAVPMPERMAPTLSLFVQRSGPYEMAALMLMSAALANNAWVAQRTFWSGPMVTIPKGERPPLRWPEYTTLALAVLFLAVANTVEAWMWLKRL